MPKLVIGLTGPIGSGVSTIADALEQNGFTRISVSKTINKKYEDSDASDFDESNRRQILQNFGNEKRRNDGAFWITESLSGLSLSDDRIVIESIRNPKEIEELRKRFAPFFFVVAVHASPETRWNRVKADYDSDQSKFDRDDKRDSEEDIDYGQQVTKCVLHADYTYVNEDPAGSRDARLKKVYNDLKEDLLLMENTPSAHSSTSRSATSDETYMATAYSQSHMSCCIKRHVGAVVVDSDGLPMSIGFNENPISMKPCIYEFQHCFKDEDMHVKMENMNTVYCPDCGGKNEKPTAPWRCVKCGDSLKLKLFPSRNMELCTAIHAEERAIRSLAGRNARDGTIYTTTFPCFQCSRYIVDAGIKRVVYVEAYPVKEALNFLQKNNIRVEPFKGFRAVAFNQIFKQV